MPATANVIQSFERMPIAGWTFSAIDELVADFGSLPVSERRAILAGMGYPAMQRASGKGCSELLSRRLKARLASWQRIQTIGK
jgi:hypothetical protein